MLLLIGTCARASHHLNAEDEIRNELLWTPTFRAPSNLRVNRQCFFDHMSNFSLEYQSKYVREVNTGNVRCNLIISVCRVLHFSLLYFLVDSTIVKSRVFISADLLVRQSSVICRLCSLVFFHHFSTFTSSTRPSGNHPNMKFFVIIMLVICLSFINQKAIEARPAAGKVSCHYPGERTILQLVKKRGQPGRFSERA